MCIEFHVQMGVFISFQMEKNTFLFGTEKNDSEMASMSLAMTMNTPQLDLSKDGAFTVTILC